MKGSEFVAGKGKLFIFGDFKFFLPLAFTVNYLAY